MFSWQIQQFRKLKTTKYDLTISNSDFFEIFKLEKKSEGYPYKNLLNGCNVSVVSLAGFTAIHDISLLRLLRIWHKFSAFQKKYYKTRYDIDFEIIANAIARIVGYQILEASNEENEIGLKKASSRVTFDEKEKDILNAAYQKEHRNLNRCLNMIEHIIEINKTLDCDAIKLEIDILLTSLER